MPGPSAQEIVLPLVDAVKERGFDVRVMVADKGYDGDPIHRGCMNRGVDPVIALKETGTVRRGAAGTPCCKHGAWTFAGADRKRGKPSGGAPRVSAPRHPSGSRRIGCTR